MSETPEQQTGEGVEAQAATPGPAYTPKAFVAVTGANLKAEDRDTAKAKGFYGKLADTTPNANYALKGAVLPTPEATPEISAPAAQANSARQATTVVSW
jgi:hypothetical protein